MLDPILHRLISGNVYRKCWGYTVLGSRYDCSTVPNLSVSSALCHTSICSSLSLFLPGSLLHSAQIKILSSICHIPGSAPAVSNDSVSFQSCHTTEVFCPSCRTSSCPISISPSLCLPQSSAFPSSGSLLILLLPTHSFSVHILEDIYEHETERVHLHHFRRRGNLHFLLQSSWSLSSSLSS